MLPQDRVRDLQGALEQAEVPVQSLGMTISFLCSALINCINCYLSRTCYILHIHTTYPSLILCCVLCVFATMPWFSVLDCTIN